MMLSSYKGARCVVLGGNGFMGRNLVNRLAELDASILIIDKAALSPIGKKGSEDEKLRKVELVLGDIRNQRLLERTIIGADAIFCLAGKSGATDSLKAPKEDLLINSYGHLTLLEVVRRKNPSARVIYPSSRLVYKKADKLPVCEDYPTEPISIYGIHKLMGEKYCLLYYRLFNIRASILRITNPYGPHQTDSQNGFGVINKFIQLAASGSTIELYGGGKQVRDYIFVRDVIEAMLLAGSNNKAIGEIFNVGSGVGIELREIARLLIQISGKGRLKTIPWPADYAAVETGSFVASISKIQKAIKWGPAVDLNTGLRLSIEYYQQRSRRGPHTNY